MLSKINSPVQEWLIFAAGRREPRRMTLRFGVSLCVALLPRLAAQSDWPAYGHDPGGMRYSPLHQITAANVATLHRAWTFHTGDSGRQFETKPIVVGGRMYFLTQTGRIVAMEHENGTQI